MLLIQDNIQKNVFFLSQVKHLTPEMLNTYTFTCGNTLPKCHILNINLDRKNMLNLNTVMTIHFVLKNLNGLNNIS